MKNHLAPLLLSTRKLCSLIIAVQRNGAGTGLVHLPEIDKQSQINTSEAGVVCLKASDYLGRECVLNASVINIQINFQTIGSSLEHNRGSMQEYICQALHNTRNIS